MLTNFIIGDSAPTRHTKELITCIWEIDGLLKFTLAIDCDFLVIGAGVAGLRAAIELAQAGTVLVIAKDSLRQSSSEYAQGGIAAALNDDDRVEFHEQDTIYAGDGLCNVQAVHTLVGEAPAAIEELIGWGRGI